jgi:pimeloyl-ACP methyl ester carboxylesterase
VEKLVLVSAAGLSSEQLHVRPLLTAARMARLGAAWVGSHSDELTRRPRARLLLAGGVMRRPDRLSGALMAEQLRGTGKPGFIDALDALASYPIRERIPEIAAPTLIVWGTHDRLVPVKDADEFERLIPNAEKVVFADTGHVPQLERPEAFNEVLREFLSR